MVKVNKIDRGIVRIIFSVLDVTCNLNLCKSDVVKNEIAVSKDDSYFLFIDNMKISVGYVKIFIVIFYLAVISPMWTQWSPWSDCSTSCGRGQMTRKRRCSHNNECFGRNSDTKDCNVHNCREYECVLSIHLHNYL